MNSVHVTFDPSSVMGGLSPYDLTWDQQMDLIHYSVVSKLDPNVSLYHRIEDNLGKLSISDRQSILWILTQWVDEAWLSIPELPVDKEWTVYRDLDDVIQTRIYSTPKEMDIDTGRIWMNRYRRHLIQESRSGVTVSQESYKHLAGYVSNIGVLNGNYKFINRR